MTRATQAPPAGARDDRDNRQGTAAGDTRLSDRVYGAIGALALLLALFFLLKGGSDDGTPPASASNVPALQFVEPAAGAELAQPVAVVFDAGAELAVIDGWWAADGRHVHLTAGGVELMAAAGDVQPLGGTRYRWTLPRLAPGEHVLRLLWSDTAHRPLAEGASAPVSIRVR